MKSGQRLGMIVVSTLLLLAVLAPTVVWAGYPHVALSPPLSPMEQAARLSGLESQTLGRKLFPSAAEAIMPKPYFQRDYQVDWISASTYERTRLAERIGNQGRARYAAEQGWKHLLGSRSRGIVQGPDSAYWDPHSGQLRVIEAKGGSSQAKRAFNALQGTNTNIIRSAEYVLRDLRQNNVPV